MRFVPTKGVAEFSYGKRSSIAKLNPSIGYCDYVSDELKSPFLVLLMTKSRTWVDFGLHLNKSTSQMGYHDESFSLGLDIRDMLLTFSGP